MSPRGKAGVGLEFILCPAQTPRGSVCRKTEVNLDFVIFIVTSGAEPRRARAKVDPETFGRASYGFTSGFLASHGRKDHLGGSECRAAAWDHQQPRRFSADGRGPDATSTGD